MTGIEIGIIALIGFLVIMFLGVPIPFSMLIAGTVGILAMTDFNVASQIMVSELFNTFSNYALTVGPMFGLMGYLASYTGIGEKLFVTMNYTFGHRKCGLANAVQVAGAGFGAICGSPPAATATFSAIAYPEMKKRGYMPEMAAGTIIAGSGLSVLIPPSNNFIVYGIVTETSIGQLFMAGIVPGLIVMALNILGILLMGKMRPKWVGSVSERHGWGERFKSLQNGGLIYIIIIFVLSMGGMFAGLFTPTEAGAVGAFGLFIITLLSRQLNWTKFKNALFAGVRLQAMVFMLLACANVFGKMFSVSKIPIALGQYVESLNAAPVSIMAVILVIYFILGMFTDLLSMTLVTMPIFFPIVCDTLGYSPIWFGIIITMVISIGALTPPVGSGVFIARGCLSYDPEATVTRLFSGVYIFVATNCIATAVFLIWPDVVTFLPALIYGT
ncbi:MAG: TRAP transporter large permease [Clostridiales Family XIII bacterium]|jgi:tripartite ATP-independent transporter DctM subunit|nr:TRAP transporter large permease [Clostridiales Family XIII bacterium]